MGTLNIFAYSDLYNLYDVVQSTHSTVIKQLLVAQLRDYFSQDSYYHYVSDVWGFPNVKDHTDLDPDAGIHDDVVTRVYIGEYFKHFGIHYPSILVKSGSIKYSPLSINRERETVQYEVIDVVDGYGNIKKYRTPKAFIFAGYWEGDLQIDILSRGIRSRDDLVELTMLLFADLRFREMEQSGVVIKSISAGNPSESVDRNDQLYKQTITLSVLSQWRREIPILNFVDAINMCIDFSPNVEANSLVTAPNLEIKLRVDLLGSLIDL